MNALVPVLISWMQQYGYPVLWGCIFIAAIGIPLPISFMLLAAGAFAAMGDFNLGWLALIALTASTAGDNISYVVGRTLGVRVIAWLQLPHRFNPISPGTLQHAHLYFIKRGGLAIFLSRSIVSALGGAINLLAGAETYPYPRFLLYDVTGEACGVAIPLLLGYTFGASWEAIGDIIGTVSLFIMALLAAIYLVYRLVRMLRRMKTVHIIPPTYKAKNPFTPIPSIMKRPDSLPL